MVQQTAFERDAALDRREGQHEMSQFSIIHLLIEDSFVAQVLCVRIASLLSGRMLAFTVHLDSLWTIKCSSCGEGGQLRESLRHHPATPSAGRGFVSDLATLGANPRRE